MVRVDFGLVLGRGGNLLNFWESKPMTRSHAD